MRRVPKSWPPTNVSPNGQNTCTMARAEQEYLAELSAVQDKTAFARSRFDQLDKGKLREVMYREQRWICIYCERTIQEGYSPPHIEHWKPLSVNHDKALCWKNLYLSCTSQGSCDNAKGKQLLKWADTDPDLPWPGDFSYQEVLGFTSRGEIYVRTDVNLSSACRRALELALNDCQNGNQKRKAILNLNHPTLVAARAAALDSEKSRLEREFRGRTASQEERADRAKSLENSGPLPAFVSVRVAWLKKMIGKGR